VQTLTKDLLPRSEKRWSTPFTEVLGEISSAEPFEFSTRLYVFSTHFWVFSTHFSVCNPALTLPKS
jgi:hypothetical protein